MLPTLCICGIGYVGLTLAVVMAEKGFEVTGVEIKLDIVEAFKKEGHIFMRMGWKGY